jgi:Rieske Fe-S protein
MDEHDQTVDERQQESALNRRTVVTGTGLLAVAAAVAACSSTTSEPAQAPPAAPAAPPPGPASNAAASQPLGSASAIPVGGGQVFAGQKVVVTQPTAGAFQGFSAVCTHQGCTVGKVANGTIDCPCHGSKFAITDGSPVNGPATSPLPARPVKVQGDQIVLG